MTNPFEDPDARYHVLVNEAGQYSLWPVFIDVPDGWDVSLESRPRDEAMNWIEEHWDDPATLGVGIRES